MAKKAYTVDMTKAITMEPLSPDIPYLCMVSAFDLGESGAGQPKAHLELSVIKPEVPGVKGRKLMDDINLVNEYTLGRLKTFLKAIGIPEEKFNVANFDLEKESADFVGAQVTTYLGIRRSDQYGDRNTIRRLAPASTYVETEALA